MHPDELENISEDSTVEPVVLNGYVRDFSKKSHSWSHDGSPGGVLGIRESEGDWCNGLLVSGVTQTEFDAYVKRETGYEFEAHQQHDTGYNIELIPTQNFTLYHSEAVIPDQVYTALLIERLASQNVHEEYRTLCYDAAATYGPTFYQDFEATTYDWYSES